MSNNNTGLEARLDKAVKSAKVRVALGFALAVASVGAVQYWLSHAHDRFAEVTPEFVSDYATAHVLDAMPTAAPEIKARLVSFAPKLLDTAEEQLLNLPDQFATQLTSRLSAEAGKLSAQAEEEMYQTLKQGIRDAAATVGSQGNDEAKLKSFADAFGELYRTESERLLDRATKKYRNDSGSAISYLEYLANGQNLTEREALQREALSTFLTIAHRKVNDGK